MRSGEQAESATSALNLDLDQQLLEEILEHFETGAGN